jgi:hypothetical protein
MPSSNFCGCTSGFRKSAHVLNKPIGSCYLKYAGTRGRFYYYICWLAGWPKYNVAASLLLKLFRCSGSGKVVPGSPLCSVVVRLQQLCEFPESANILSSSTSVYINEEFSKPTISMCNQEDKENAGYENFDNANVAASLLMLFRCSAKKADYKSRVSFQKVLTSCLQLLCT